MSNKSAIVMLKEVSQRLTQRRDNLRNDMEYILTPPLDFMKIVAHRTKVDEFSVLEEEIKEIGKCILKLRGDKWRI